MAKLYSDAKYRGKSIFRFPASGPWLPACESIIRRDGEHLLYSRENLLLDRDFGLDVRQDLLHFGDYDLLHSEDLLCHRDYNFSDGKHLLRSGENLYRLREDLLHDEEHLFRR
jgi:hypothetical protein